MELVYRHYLAQFLHILALWSRHYLLLSPQGYVHNSCPYRTFTNGFVFCKRKMHIIAAEDLTVPDLHFCC